MGIFALFSVVSVVACLVGAHVQNRRILKAGATWRAGSDDEHLRVDTPVLTLLLRREGLQLSTPLGKHLVLVKAGSMKQGTLLPAALLVEPVWSCTESGARLAESPCGHAGRLAPSSGARRPKFDEILTVPPAGLEPAT